MNTAFFDLSGTLLQYGQSKVIPLMDKLVMGLKEEGWSVSVVSRYSVSHCQRLLADAGLVDAVSVLSSERTSKGEVVSQALKERNLGEVLFVDDKPANLASVLSACGGEVRVVGFVGSGRYVPELSNWCRCHGVELALSPVDLFEGLKIRSDACRWLFDSADKRTEAELAGLIPGLDHPMSSISGETAFFDHRAVVTELLENRHLKNFDLLWRNIAWVTCNECLWKLLVRTVLLSLSLNVNEVLGTAYKHMEYTEALRSWVQKHRGIPLRPRFDQAVAAMEHGIQWIGQGAEVIRMKDRPAMETYRIEAAKKRLSDVLI